MILGVLLVRACAEDSAGRDAGVSFSDVEELESRIGVLEDRLGELEEGNGAGAGDSEVAESDELIGQTVTVSAEVTRRIDAMGFVISGEEDEDLAPLGPETGEGILVVSAKDPGVTVGDVVQVVRTVREFVISDFEQDLGIELDDNLYGEFEDQLALAARSIDTTPNRTLGAAGD